MYKKVSLVTPCYNGESYLSRYLDCLLKQDYPNIELILVNDGSVDSTELIFDSYRKRIEDKGIQVIYIKQENQGLAGAVNTGIKYISGDYLAWPDSDDIILPNFVSSRVKTLEEHPNSAIVVSPIEIVDENDLDTVIGKANDKLNWGDEERSIYFDVLRLQNILVFPGSFMLRTEAFRKANPKMDFPHPKEVGQDFQMLLPITYLYPACFCNEISFRYVIRANSHSHASKSKEKTIEKYQIAKKLLESLSNDYILFKSENDKKITDDNIIWRYYRWMMDIGIQYNDMELYKTYYKKMDKSFGIPFKTQMEYFRLKSILFDKFYRSLSNLKNSIFNK